MKFKRRESVRKAVKRLARQRTEKALASLKHCKRLEAVHEVRKEIKRLRALLRLVRPSISRSGYRRHSGLLRNAAGYLSEARDAYVKVSALTELMAHQDLAPGSFRAIKDFLSKECRKEQALLLRRNASPGWPIAQKCIARAQVAQA